MAAHSHRKSRPRPVKLSAKLTAIVQEQLERVFYETGRRVMMAYLENLTEAQVLKVLGDKDPDRLRSLVAEALTAVTDPDPETSAAPRLQSLRYFPSTRTRDCLTLLTAAVQSHPDLRGIPLPAACQLLTAELHHTLHPTSLRQLLKRNSEFHQLTVHRDRVRLQSDILVQVIAQRRESAVALTTDEIPAKPQFLA